MIKSIDEYKQNWRYVAESVFLMMYILAKQTKGFFSHDLIFQRFYPTRIVYNHVYDKVEMININLSELPEHVIFFLHADDRQLQRRLKSSEGYIKNWVKWKGMLNKIIKIQNIMNEYLKSLIIYKHITVIYVDTSNMSTNDYLDVVSSFMYGEIRDMMNLGKNQIKIVKGIDIKGMIVIWVKKEFKLLESVTKAIIRIVIFTSAVVIVINKKEKVTNEFRGERG